MFDRLQGPGKIFAWVGIGIAGLAFAAGMALLFGLIAMWLWNWLMPEIFGLKAITFWQAWGLVLLGHIFFKGGHGPGHQNHGSKGKIEPEWKSEFKRKFREECGEHFPKSEETGNKPDEEGPLTGGE